MPHLDEGILHGLLDGEIGSPEIGRIEGHLAECEACQARLAGARQFRAAAFSMLESLDEVPVPMAMIVAESPIKYAAATPKRTMRWLAPIGLAAAVMLALVIRNRPAVEQETPLAESTPAPRGTNPPAMPLASRLPRRATAATEARTSPQTLADAAKRAEREVGTTAQLSASPAPAEAAPPPTVAPRVALRQALDAGARSNALGKTDKLLLPESGFAVAGGKPAAVSADRAIKTLGGSIRLVDGLTPERYELSGIVVRVIYRTAWGPLTLEQWRAGNVLAYRLLTEPGTPGDSVAAWNERIR